MAATVLRKIVFGLPFLWPAVSHAVADEIFPAGISVTGTFLYDNIGGSLVVNDVTQTGSIFISVGGNSGAATTTTTYDGLTTNGVNPLTPSLTHHGQGVVGSGDGFGGTASVAATSDQGAAEFRGDVDLVPVVITNSSGIPYVVTMSLEYSHSVTANGDDAYLRSDLDLDLNGSEIFTSELVSDTIFGNFNNGPIAGAGGTVSETGVFTFDVALAAGQNAGLHLDYTLDNQFVFPFELSDGTVQGDASYFLSVTNVAAVPEPAGYLLVVAMLPLCCMRRNRSWRMLP